MAGYILMKAAVSNSYILYFLCMCCNLCTVCILSFSYIHTYIHCWHRNRLRLQYKYKTCTLLDTIYIHTPTNTALRYEEVKILSSNLIIRDPNPICLYYHYTPGPNLTQPDLEGEDKAAGHSQVCIGIIGVIFRRSPQLVQVRHDLLQRPALRGRLLLSSMETGGLVPGAVHVRKDHFTGRRQPRRWRQGCALDRRQGYAAAARGK